MPESFPLHNFPPELSNMVHQEMKGLDSATVLRASLVSKKWHNIFFAAAHNTLELEGYRRDEEHSTGAPFETDVLPFSVILGRLQEAKEEIRDAARTLILRGPTETKRFLMGADGVALAPPRVTLCLCNAFLTALPRVHTLEIQDVSWERCSPEDVHFVEELTTTIATPKPNLQAIELRRVSCSSSTVHPLLLLRLAHKLRRLRLEGVEGPTNGTIGAKPPIDAISLRCETEHMGYFYLTLTKWQTNTFSALQFTNITEEVLDDVGVIVSRNKQSLQELELTFTEHCDQSYNDILARLHIAQSRNLKLFGIGVSAGGHRPTDHLWMSYLAWHALAAAPATVTQVKLQINLPSTPHIAPNQIWTKDTWEMFDRQMERFQDLRSFEATFNFGVPDNVPSQTRKTLTVEGSDYSQLTRVLPCLKGAQSQPPRDSMTDDTQRSLG
ncbi:hypothetical protein NM688_g3817 [Phlebia brevispora]|uniref:Uncharacterized protein n=1 Tax=Phlebia brevispora TaxID=194682 RepID=A0ACC1T4L7_9APHY|nr:hypothetical protein NM688_g3817 [Phlebia brevispora]